MIILVMGVCGSGKSTVGKLLADRLSSVFLEADDYHPARNREKLAMGIPLTDTDRYPWLLAIRGQIDLLREKNRDVVLACSALKGAYRGILLAGHSSATVLLQGSRRVLLERLTTRQGHFMNPLLLDSQLDTLETPSSALIYDITLPAVDIVESVVQHVASP